MIGVPPAGHPRVVGVGSSSGGGGGGGGERRVQRRSERAAEKPLTSAVRSQVDLDAAAQAYGEAVRRLDLRAVQADLRKLFVESKAEWPADYGNYG